jgi:hypothetical protein
MTVDITSSGYLLLPAAVAEAHFPNDLLFAIPRPPELWLLPARGPAAGGLLMKQRNLDGDRSVLIWEALPDATDPGTYPAHWDDASGALRIGLSAPVSDREASSAASTTVDATRHASS